MKPILVFACLLLGQIVHAQQAANRVYPVGNALIAVGDSADVTAQSLYPLAKIEIRAIGNSVFFSTGTGSFRYPPAKFLNMSGAAYSATSADDAVKGFRAAVAAAAASSGGGGGSGLAPTTGTPTLTTSTTSGTITAGATFISIYNSGTAAGTVLGTSIAPGTTITFPSVVAQTYVAVAYNATNTTFLIQVTR